MSRIKENKSVQNESNIWKNTLNILQKKERRNLVFLMLISLITAFAQSVGIATFLPFMNLLLDLNSIHKNTYLNWTYNALRFKSDREFVIFAGVVVGILILISNILSIINNLIKTKYVLTLSHNISRRLLRHYLYKPYEFILQKNSSELVKGVLSDSSEFVSNYLNSIIDLAINFMMIIFILGMLLFVNVQVTLFVVGFFVVIYGSLTFFSKTKLKQSGIRVMNANQDRHKFAYEALNGFKISKTMGIEEYFIERYTKSSKKAARYSLFSKVFQDVPKNIIEALVFCGLTVAIVVIIIQQRDLNVIIPTISVYVIAGYRIMPEVAKVFNSISKIIHHIPVVNRLYMEMADSNGSIIKGDEITQRPISNTEITFNKHLDLRNVDFYYQNSDKIINGLSLRIPAGSVIGFAGTTGAGKTTLIDIIIGLLPPAVGGLYIDDTLIDSENVRSWRRLIGYVPQDIYLIDDTIKANIAFGVKPDEIDEERMKLAAEIAAIANFIETELPNGYDAMIGERGVRLSGGQRQRIGLARALYRDPKVLILDEATSALDGATESTVVSSIHTRSNVQTIIIIAHRLNTLKPCDQIYLLEYGKILDHGTYDDLISNNPKFRQMAKIEKSDVVAE